MSGRTGSGERRRSEMTELRKELRNKQSYLDEDSEELWTEISRWLMLSYNVPVGSLRTMVRTSLAELQEDHKHKMFDHPEVDDGEEAFPDECESCPHYGVQCPPLARRVPKQSLDRIFEEAEDDDQLQAKLSPYAAKHHCHVIQDTIDEWETGYSEFLRWGEELRTRLNADIKNIDMTDVNRELGLDGAGIDDEGDSSAPSARENAMSTLSDAPSGEPALAGDTPPEGVPERVEKVSESLMGEDEDEGEA